MLLHAAVIFPSTMLPDSRAAMLLIITPLFSLFFFAAFTPRYATPILLIIDAAIIATPLLMAFTRYAVISYAMPLPLCLRCRAAFFHYYYDALVMRHIDDMFSRLLPFECRHDEYAHVAQRRRHAPDAMRSAAMLRAAATRLFERRCRCYAAATLRHTLFIDAASWRAATASDYAMLLVSARCRRLLRLMRYTS